MRARPSSPGIVDADTANAAMPKYQAIKHALTSNKELGVLWNKKIKECGLFFDKVLKKYTPRPRRQRRRSKWDAT